MKGWLKLLVLGAIPILAVTMVANQALAADKGSQLDLSAQHGSHAQKLHLHCKRPRYAGGYGAHSVLQRRDGAGSLVPENSPAQRKTCWSTPLTM